MEITTEQVGDVTVVDVITANLDASNAARFKQLMMTLIQKNQRIVLDLRVVGFVDSSGVGALLSALRQASSVGANIKLCETQKPVLVLFELVRMHRVFEILNTREEAIASYRESPETA